MDLSSQDPWICILYLIVTYRGAKKKPYLTAGQFVEFLNTEQRDPRLNEILYPYYDVKRAQDIIDYFEPNSHMVSKGTHCLIIF